MKILEIPSIFFPRGGAFCLDQAKALARRGHEVRILACVELGITDMPKDYLTRPLGIHWQEYDGIETCTFYARRLPRLTKLNNKRWIETVMLMMEEYVSRHGLPDIIHAHSVHWAGYAAMKISERWGVPYVITEHSSRAIFEMEFGEGVTDCWQIPLLKEALHKAKVVIPVAEELVENLSPLFGTDYRHSSISNTIDTDFFVPRERDSHSCYSFVYPAVFFPLKAHDLLLESMRIVASRIGNVHLHLAGRGTDSQKMKQLISSHGLYGKVTLHGSIGKAAMRQLYYDSDCLVVPSRSEAQPLICLEAAATGLPFVGTEVIPRSLRFPGCTIVPIDNAQALADAMCAMVAKGCDTDPTSLYNKVKAMASPEAFARKFEETVFGN